MYTVKASDFNNQSDYGIITVGQIDPSENTYPFIAVYHSDWEEPEPAIIDSGIAIVDKTFTSAGDDKIRLITKTGEKKNYTLKINAGINEIIKAQSTDTAKSDSEWPLEDRIVNYTVNSKNECILSAPDYEVYRQNICSYDALQKTIGDCEISDNSIILDAAEFAADGKYDVEVRESDYFEDGLEYGIIAAGKENDDDAYPFIVIYQKNNHYTINTPMAVFSDFNFTVINDEDVIEMTAYVGGTEQKIYCDLYVNSQLSAA